MNVLIWVILHIIFSMSPQVTAQSGADVNNLLTQLFTTNGYNKNIRPLKNQTHIMNVAVDFYLSSVIEFDEQDENLKTAGYLSMTWTDEYLQWNASDYNGVQSIFVPQDDIWKPDMSLKNSFKSFTGLGSSYLNVFITAGGAVEWNPFQVLQSTCSVDITYFPFDSQTCDLKFTAWSYTKSDVELNKGTKGIQLDDYSSNNQWTLSSTSGREVNTAETAVIFSVTLKRKPGFYIMNIIIPIVLLTLVNCATFILPVASGERAGFSITVFLALAVFLTIVASELPKNSENTSLLAVYIMLMTSLSTLIVMMSLVQIRLSTREVTKNPIGKPFMLVYKLSNFLRCRSCKTSRIIDLNVTKGKMRGQMEEEEVTWMHIINALDFFLFWACTVFTCLCTVIILSVAATYG